MRILVSWLRDFVDVTASAEEIGEGLALRGFELAGIEPAPAGVRPPWQEITNAPDAVLDFEVTANRPDCLSVCGMAREVATLYDLPMRLPSEDPGAAIGLKRMATGESDRLKVTLEDADLCPRYAAAIAGVKVGASPDWLAARLQAAGIRPISTIVDISNYVLVELGHPTHAFDLARLEGAELRIRRAAPGERITTLDGVERMLGPDMLVIADASRPQAIAGVMGGADSEVLADTRTVAFESAYFRPASVRRTSKRLTLKTEASARFERGADISMPGVALERVIALMECIGAGRADGPIVDLYPNPRHPVALHLRRDRLAGLLGATIDPEQVERILRRLGLAVVATADGWNVTAPMFRVDLLREVDLIEEVGRFYGFDKLVPSFPPVTAPAPPPDPRIPRDELVRRVLGGAGLSEALTFGFIEAPAAEAFRSADGQAAAKLENPLSAKFAVLRPSLLPGLVDAIAHNRRHGRRDVRLFELGARFPAAAGETRAVAIAWTGAAEPEHWSGPSREVGFFDAKGLTERLCSVLGVTPRFQTRLEPFLVPGRAASIVLAEGRDEGRTIGLVGQLAPAVAETRGLPPQDAVLVAELDLDLIWAARTIVEDAVRPLSRHPSVVRDLSIVVAETLPAETIRGTIQAAGAMAAAPLVAVGFFDRYRGKGVPEGAVSVSVRLTFQASDRTLTDEEVQQGFDAIVAALAHEHGAVQR
jgi:phenylalanyl-tRNA synthetase beta chain